MFSNPSNNSNEFSCPVNKSHILKDHVRLHKHILRCKEMRPYKKIYVCGFKSTHMFVTEKERKLHHKVCSHQNSPFNPSCITNLGYDSKAKIYRASTHIESFYQKNKSRLKEENKKIKKNKESIRVLAYNQEADPQHVYKNKYREWKDLPFIFLKFNFTKNMGKLEFVELPLLNLPENVQLSNYSLKNSVQELQHVIEIKRVPYLDDILNGKLSTPNSKLEKVVACYSLLTTGEGSKNDIDNYMELLRKMRDDEFCIPFSEEGSSLLAFVPTKLLKIDLGPLRDFTLICIQEGIKNQKIEYELHSDRGLVDSSVIVSEEKNMKKKQLKEIEEKLIFESEQWKNDLKNEKIVDKILLERSEKIRKISINFENFISEKIFLKKLENKQLEIEKFEKKIKSLKNSSHNQQQIQAILNKAMDTTPADFMEYEQNVDELTQYEKMGQKIFRDTKGLYFKYSRIVEVLKQHFKNYRRTKSKISGASRKSAPASSQIGGNLRVIGEDYEGLEVQTAKQQKEEKQKVRKELIWKKLPKSNEDYCKMCMGRVKDTLYSPCGHILYCWYCSKTLRGKLGFDCEICGEQVRGIYLVLVK